ncbi:MAG: tetratricopeptide repeat protein [Gemmatimonadetes bacterium]|nr:tetratricopeptide repeat protein [Gemmatimonadota bacterium]
MSRDRRGVAVAIAGSAAVALAYRALVAWQLGRHPELLAPVLDGAAHLEWARGWLAGTWPGGEPFFRAPGYVALLAGELAAAGGSVRNVAFFQLLVGGPLVAAFVAAIAGRLGGRGAAWLGGVAAALYPTFAFFDFQFLPPFAGVALAVAAGAATLAADERPSTLRIALAGLLWSAAVVVRPPLLAPAMLLPAALVFRADRRLRGAAGATLAILALPLLVTGHNIRSGDPAFLATQGGLNFYLGNGKDADGYAATFPDAPTALGYRMMEAATAIAEREEGRTLRPSEVSRHWSARAWRDLADDPGRAAGRFVKKAWLFVSAREIPNNHDPVLAAELVSALRLPGWGLWFPLATLGAVLLGRRRDTRLVAGFVAAIAFGCVVFFVNARFRVPAAPFVIALGAAGAIEAVKSVRDGRAAALRVAVPVALLAAVLVAWNPYRLPKTAWPGAYVLVAEAERNRGEPVRALRWIRRALEVEPDFYSARVAEIELLRRTGQLGEAEAAVDRLLAAAPGEPTLLSEKAALADLRGDTERGLALIEHVLAVDPGNVDAELNRAVMLARLDRAEEAQDVLEAVIARRPGSAAADRARRILASLRDLAPPPREPGADE